MITLGLDPHPGGHTVVALDENGASLGYLAVPNTPQGVEQLHEFAARFFSRRGRKKNDVVDAENVARALLANLQLAQLHAVEQQRELQELTRHSVVCLNSLRPAEGLYKSLPPNPRCGKSFSQLFKSLSISWRYWSNRFEPLSTI